MMKSSYIFLVYSVLLLTGGCVIPVPHKRVSVVGCEGIVLNATDGTPIGGAAVSIFYSNKKSVTVFTDAEGCFHVPNEFSWHGAFFFGIPASFSLFPLLDAPRFPTMVSASAPMYWDWVWTGSVVLDNIEDTDMADARDPSRIMMMPKDETSPVPHKTQ